MVYQRETGRYQLSLTFPEEDGDLMDKLEDEADARDRSANYVAQELLRNALEEL